MARRRCLDDNDDGPARVDMVADALPATVDDLCTVLGGCSRSTVYYYLNLLQQDGTKIVSVGHRRPRIYDVVW